MQQILASRLMSSRRGTALLGLAAAVLAGVVLLAYLNSYRKSVRTSTEPVTVLVARSLIEKGTSGTVIASNKLFQPSEIAKDQAKEGAITDPASIRDRVAQVPIYPGQQLTAADFSVETTTAVPTQITGTQRAIAIAIDASHGNLGQLQTGDHVDVYVGLAETVRLLLADVLVLRAPGAAGDDASVVLRVKSSEAALVAYSADNAQLWLVARPQTGASETKATKATASNVLGFKPQTSTRSSRAVTSSKSKSASSGSASTAPSTSPAPGVVGSSKFFSTPSSVAPQPPLPLPTSARISVNGGKTELLTAGKSFPAADPMFRLGKLTRTSAVITTGRGPNKRKYILPREGRLVLVHKPTGVRYVLRLKGLS
jgi:Flp pilus assembly protein CpaB